MHKRLSALLLLALLLALAGCGSQPAAVTAPKGGLTWTGSALEGARFYEREFSRFTVHYSPPTLPDTAEWVGQSIDVVLNDLEREGRWPLTQRLHVWMVPPGYAWPEGAGFGDAARAVAPYRMIVRTFTNEGSLPGLSFFRPYVSIAVSQGPNSPLFTTQWLHLGMGRILTEPPDAFTRLLSNGVQGISQDMFATLESSVLSQDYYMSATLLSAMLVDRWGWEWHALHAEQAVDLSPRAIAQWVTGREDPEEAMGVILDRARWVRNQTLSYNSRYNGMTSMADMSPVRIQPELAQLPKGQGPMANYSPQRYEINARYDPTKRTVDGELTLTWRNGEGVPLDTLYFNLWANSEQSIGLGGGTAVTAVKVGGQTAAFTARGLDLVVPLGRAVGPGEEVIVQVAFQTRLGGLNSRLSGQGTAGRVHLVDWYPSLAVLDERGWQLTAYPANMGEPPAEHADFQVQLEVPKGVVLAGTGSLARREEQGDRVIYWYDAPKTTGWVAVGGTGFLMESRSVGGVTVRVIDTDAGWIREVMEHTSTVLPMMAQQYGPYPSKELVVAKHLPILALPGLVTTMDTSNDRWMLSLYNGLGHQWFGMGVGNDQWAEPWLDESFARYVERRLARDNGLAQFAPDLKGRAASLPPKASLSTTELLRLAEYIPALWDKGPWVLEELEATLGTAQMNRLLTQWNARYRYRTATTADFIRLVEEMTGQAWHEWFAEHGIDPADRASYQPLFPLGKYMLP